MRVTGVSGTLAALEVEQLGPQTGAHWDVGVTGGGLTIAPTPAPTVLHSLPSFPSPWPFPES